MFYSILIYDSEELVEALSPEEEAGRLARHLEMQAALRTEKRLGSVVRLMPTTTAVSLRGGPIDDVVLDGPFAETKEQLVGFYLVDCPSLEEALTAARRLPLDSGSLEVRPVRYFDPGVLEPAAPTSPGRSPKPGGREESR